MGFQPCGGRLDHTFASQTGSLLDLICFLTHKSLSSYQYLVMKCAKIAIVADHRRMLAPTKMIVPNFPI
jgi:hypothetical protein